MLVSTKKMFEHCYGDYGIAAVNVFTMEQILSLFSAANKTSSPVIVQITPVARNYVHPIILSDMIVAAAKIFPDVVYATHLDHGNIEHAINVIDSGMYSSVMIDASYEPIKDNIKITRAIVEKAHAKGIVVEAELGILSGVEDDVQVDEKQRKYTQPSEVEYFVKQTKCDSLAVAVGTSHGAYKFSSEPGIRFDILSEIQNRLPLFPLVLHGGSAVNKEEIERINNAGGKLAEGAKGLDENQLTKAIKLGVCKINIATDLRLIWARTHREFFKNFPDKFDPIIPGKNYMEDTEKFLFRKFDILGASGKAKQFKNDSR